MKLKGQGQPGPWLVLWPSRAPSTAAQHVSPWRCVASCLSGRISPCVSWGCGGRNSDRRVAGSCLWWQLVLGKALLLPPGRGPHEPSGRAAACAHAEEKTEDGLRFLGQQPCALVHLGRVGEFLCLSPQALNPTFHTLSPLARRGADAVPKGVSEEGLC